jgi:hypothetical protein
MTFLLGFLIFVYLVAGFVYAVYVHKNGKEKWYMFPVNVIGGPVMFLYLAKLAKQRRRPPYGRI